MCNNCVRLKTLKNSTPKCDCCNRPSLDINNLVVLEIWSKYKNGFCSDSINLVAIDKAMDYVGVSEKDRPLVAQKLIIWSTIILNKQVVN